MIVPLAPAVEWIVVVPVKGTRTAKSRLGAGSDMAMAIALDTVEAALGAARVVVVTSRPAAPAFAVLGASVVIDRGIGLNEAIAQGIGFAVSSAGPGTGTGSGSGSGSGTGSGTGAGTDPRPVPIAVLLGDLPALTSAELAAALAAGARHPRVMVPDAESTGTVLITALDGRSHAPAFGPGSREAHLLAGYVELEVPMQSGLRRDVDTMDQLTSLSITGLGWRTRAAIESGTLSQ